MNNPAKPGSEVYIVEAKATRQRIITLLFSDFNEAEKVAKEIQADPWISMGFQRRQFKGVELKLRIVR